MILFCTRRLMSLGKGPHVAQARRDVSFLPRNQPKVQMHLTDKFGRAISDLRISITDRCNYKCVYCRTGNEGAQYADLKLDEYLRMVRVMVSLGIEKVRITGGEPLLRS